MYTRVLTSTVLLLFVGACSNDIYLRDGVTDGDTFYLAQYALSDPDPVLQSWVSYSLGRSTCQLQLGGENPARATSFECELMARRLLLQSWSEKALQDPDASDPYLDDLSLVQEANFLPEYVARYLGKSHWSVPDEVRERQFRTWQRLHLPGHKSRTVLTGSWNYSRRVTRNP